MKNLLMLSTIIGVLLVSGSIFYHYVIFLPEQARGEDEKESEALKALEQSMTFPEDKRTDGMLESIREALIR